MFSVTVVNCLLPAFRAEVSALDGNIGIISLDLAQDGSSKVVRLRANLLHPDDIERHAVYPVGWGTNVTGGYQVLLNARGVLQATSIFLIVVLSWPHRSYKELLIRVLLAIPLAGWLIAIDAPLELLGNFQQAVIHGVDPHIVRPLFRWDKFLEGGGNVMLALASAAMAIVLSQGVSGNAVRAGLENE